LLRLLGSLLLVWTGSLTDAFAPHTASLRLNSLSVHSDIGKTAGLFRSPTRPAVPASVPSFSSASSRRTTTRSSSSSSQLNAVSTVAVAAITGAVSGGLFAGGLHAVAGTSYDMQAGHKQQGSRQNQHVCTPDESVFTTSHSSSLFFLLHSHLTHSFTPLFLHLLLPLPLLLS